MSSLATASPEFLRIFRQALEAYDAGDFTRAYELFVQAQEIEPDNVWALLWCGATAPSPQEAVTWLEQAKAIDPDNPHADAGLAWARQQIATAEPAAEEEPSLAEWADDGGAPTAVEEPFSTEEVLPETATAEEEEWTFEEPEVSAVVEEPDVAEEKLESEAAQETVVDETWLVEEEEELLDIEEEDIPDWLRGEEPETAVAEVEDTSVADTEWLLEEETEAPPAEAAPPDWLFGESEAAPAEVTPPLTPPEGSLPPPNEVVAAYQAGLAAWEENRLEDAARYFEQTVRLDPNHVQAYDYLGSVYFLLGYTDKAIQVYKRAISIDPTYATTYFNLGLVYQEIGDKENAIAMYEKYLEFDPDSTYAENARTFLQQLRGEGG